MALSVCMITADPPTRVAAILEGLRPHAEEVLIAADSRVDADTLAGYGALADRLFRIEYRQGERHLWWLFAQCRCEWILRVDGDEVPSRAFLRALPEMLASRAAQQFWTPSAWLFPDASSVLGDAPWSGDFAVRMMRNDGTLRVRGLQHLHAEPVRPREYRSEPFYHLDLLTSTLAQRCDKVVRYEAGRPRVLAAGGGRMNEAFYLPELRDSLALLPAPEEDRPAVQRALAARAEPPSTCAPDGVPYVSLEEMDRWWEGQAVRPDAYRASIESREPAPALAPRERRQLYFTVANQGTARWPASLDANPPIRLAYRWLHGDGSVHTPEGPRSPFSRVLAPGERILTPLDVKAPAETGDYVLEVDVVHEHVRWFDCACRVPVRVGHHSGLPPAGSRIRETPSPGRRRWRRMRIPRTIHRVWLGEQPIPEEQERFAQTFAHHHPGWEMRLWTDADLPALAIGAPERLRARSQRELSNLARYELLQRHGGVYVDTDVECLRALTPLLRGVDAFAALELEDRVGTAVLGAVAAHPAFARAARLARDMLGTVLGTGVRCADATGPDLLTLILEQEENVAIFAKRLFYPYLWDEPERRHERLPDAYTVHHRAHGRPAGE